MLLDINPLAGMILHMFEAGAFAGVETTAVGTIARFVTGDVDLLALEPNGLARVQAAIVQAGGDPLLLMGLTLVDPRIGGGGNAKRDDSAEGDGEYRVREHDRSPFLMMHRSVQRGCVENPLVVLTRQLFVLNMFA
jgi:hypothetical protein